MNADSMPSRLLYTERDLWGRADADTRKVLARLARYRAVTNTLSPDECERSVTREKMTVEVHLRGAAPIFRGDVFRTESEGGLYRLHLSGGRVELYPLIGVGRIVEWR